MAPGRGLVSVANEDSTPEHELNIISTWLESAGIKFMNQHLSAPRNIARQTQIYGLASGLDATPLSEARTTAPDDARIGFNPPSNPPARPEPTTPFGIWLFGQDRRSDWIGDLAKAAKADRAFPKQGDPDAVRHRLSSLGAEADMLEALDAAEIEWLCF